MSQDTEYEYDNYNVNDFFDNWNSFIKKYRNEFPLNLLSNYGFKSFVLDDLTNVVVSASKGEQNALNRLENVRKYLRATFYDIKQNFRGFDDDYEELENTRDEFKEIIEDLKPENFKKIINLATPEEKMMVRSISRQGNIKLPEDVQKEIISNIGIGGRGYKKNKSKHRKTYKKPKKLKRKSRTRLHKKSNKI